MFGLREILHSDQGCNFESVLLWETLDSFGVKKSQTTACHPHGDRMVERFNQSLLQMLRVYIQDQADWERYSPFVQQCIRLPGSHPLNSCLTVKPHLTTTIPQCLRCEYVPIPATFYPDSITKFCGDAHHGGISPPEDTVWSSCARTLFPSRRHCLAVYSYCRKAGTKVAGGGRSNPSEVPTPTRLAMAQYHGLYTATNYSDKSNPHSEHYPTWTCPGHHLLSSMKRWCLKKCHHSLGIQPSITDHLTDCSSSLGRATSEWGRCNMDSLECSSMF